MKSKALKIEIFILANDVSDRIRNHQMTTRWQHLPGETNCFTCRLKIVVKNTWTTGLQQGAVLPSNGV